jgi:hypothetical protein
MSKKQRDLQFEHQKITWHFALLFLITLQNPFLSLIPCNAGTIWDNWYTVSQDGAPQSYYNEKFDDLKETVKIQLNTWILVDAKTKTVQSENLGATAKNTTLLEPIRYNFRTVENKVEKSIDGSVQKDGKIFTSITTLNGKPSHPLKAEMIPKLILTSFFSVWVHKNYKRINGAQPIEFHAIVEDQTTDQVPVIKGTAYEMMADDFAKKTKTRKLRIEFNQLVAFWWINPNGEALKITLPSLKKEVLKVDRGTALAFFGKP